MKYYVVTFLGEDVNEGAWCNVCGVYTDIQSAKYKIIDVINDTKKMLRDNEISYELEESPTKCEIYNSCGDWSYTIEIQIIDKN